MNTVTMYRSDDGVLFDSKEKCEAYEHKSVIISVETITAINEIRNNVQFYNDKYELLTITEPTIDNLEQIFRKVKFCKIHKGLSDKTKYWIRNNKEERYIFLPIKKGLYAWVNFGWKNYNDIRKEYNKLWPYFTGIVLP